MFHVTPYIPHQLFLVARHFVAHRVGLEVIIHILIRVQFRTVGRNVAKLNLAGNLFAGQPVFHHTALVGRMAVDNQEYLPAPVLD